MITVSSWTEFILNIIWSHRKQNWASVWGTFARSHRGDSSCHRKCSSAVSFNEWLLCQRWNGHSSASLWLFNSVFSICGEHVCPFSFGLHVFMWCVTFSFLCLVTEGRASSGVASLLVVSSLHVSFTPHHSERFPLLCSSECEAEVFCVPAELLLHPASLLSLI